MKTKFLITILLVFNIKLSANENIGIDTKIFKNLRCLVCQGQTIAESNSDFAQTVKIVVRDKISQGSNEEEIYEFLSEKYGEWIVYKPSVNNINLVLWLLPYLVLIIGGIIIFNIIKKRSNN